jgi:thiol-disulfide isomerase/thioredoxin
MKRRQLLFAGAGTAAAAAGLGLAWHRERAAAPVRPPDNGLWSLVFEQPGGGTLQMASLRGHPLLLNFWATWCPPCVKEMPLLDEFHRQRRAAGWRVVGLAVDGPDPVREYLARLPMSFPIGLAGLDGTALSRSLGNTTGALPFTVVFDTQGHAAARKLGTVTPAELADWGERYGRPA